MSPVDELKGHAKRILRRFSRTSSRSQAALEPARWGLVHTAQKGLTLEGLSLHGLLAEWGSPLHVVHAGKLRENVRAFTTVPKGSATGCDVYFSQKTNPVPGVLSFLYGLGIGAEVISHYELWLARRLGVPPEKIIYNGPAKSDDSIREAVEMGVHVLNVNHREEIPRVARIAAQVGKRVRVGIRVSVGTDWSFQFGTPVAGGAALEAFREALSFPSLDVVGLHVHRGVMLRREDEQRAYLQAVLDFESTLSRELKLELSVLNFGGSLCTPTVQSLSVVDQRLNQAVHRDLPVPDPDTALSIERYVSVLVEAVNAHFASRGRAMPRIAVEPGRALTGNAQILLTTVLSTKRSDGTTFAIMDAGVNHAECVRNEYHQLFAVNRFGTDSKRTYTVVGPICSPVDTLYRAVRLPHLHAGDSLAIMDAGAYFVPFATSFSFPQPAIVMLDGGHCRLLRRAERFEDLVMLDAPAVIPSAP